VLLFTRHCTPVSIIHKGMQAVVTLLEYNVAYKLAETLAAAIVRRVDPLK